MTKYLLAGGGTAGHVNPLLAVADRLREREPESSVLVLGTAEGLEARLVPLRGYELVTVARLPFPRRLSLLALRFPRRFFELVSEIQLLIRANGIEVLVGFGGYVSAPAYLAARREKIAIVVHEANAKPGMANRLGACLTRFVGVAFAGTRLAHHRLVGMPLRREIETMDRASERRTALAFFGLSAARPTLLITGGSLGARHINEIIVASAATIVGAGWQVLHIAGERSAVLAPGFDEYVLLAYCDRMELALAAADLAVARAGAATVSEFTGLGLAAVYVPLEIGNGEQRLNARAVVAAGGAIVVDNSAFTPQWILTDLIPLLQNRALIADMSARARAVGILDGADRTVDLVLEAVRSTEGLSR